MMWTDDPIRDYDRYCAEQEKQLDRLPTCSECGEPITDDYCYCIEGEYMCEECMVDNYRVATPVEE